jgi:diguanylate cyclase (GGDEF)-like protein
MKKAIEYLSGKPTSFLFKAGLAAVHFIGFVDRLLQSVGRVIRDNVRVVDFTARLGGDEFAELLPQAHAGSARTALSKLQRLLAQTMGKERWPVTFSFGVVTFLKAPESTDIMIQRADGPMYCMR